MTHEEAVKEWTRHLALFGGVEWLPMDAMQGMLDILARHKPEVLSDQILGLGDRVICGRCSNSDDGVSLWPCPDARAAGVTT